MYDMEITIRPRTVFETTEANYLELCSMYFNDVDFEEGFYWMLDELYSLCELDSDTAMSSSALCDLVVQQSNTDQSNVLTNRENDDQEDGDNLPVHGGWVKVHRQMIEHGWLPNHPLLALWLYLLLKASFKEHICRIPVNRNNAIVTRDITLKPGQLVFGRKRAAEETGLSEQNVRTLIAYLKRSGSIEVQPTPDFSIVTITNWLHYQQ